MKKNVELTLCEASQKIFNLIYNKNNNKRMDIIKAYSYIYNRYEIDYSYDEIKDYLFHHEMKVTE